MKIISVVVLLALAAASGCQHVEKRVYTPGFGRDHLIFTSFVHKEERHLYLLYSRNGYAWRNLGPYLTTTEFGLRDPMIAQGPDGVFHCVWSTGRRFAVGYARSENLVDWTTPRLLPVMGPIKESRNAWAPELYYDDEAGEWLILWSSSVHGSFEGTRGGGEQDGVPWNHRIFACTTSDFETLSKPFVLFDPGFSVIDGSLIKRDGIYYLIYKNESVTTAPDSETTYHDYIEIVQGPTPRGPWSQTQRPLQRQWIEGPAPVELGDELVIYFDQYSRGKYGAIASKDMQTWRPRSVAMTVPKGHRHGSVIRITPEIAKVVLEHATTTPEDDERE